MSFTCPRCGATSHHPQDEIEGYCGACHDWTGEAQLDFGDETVYCLDIRPRPEFL